MNAEAKKQNLEKEILKARSPRQRIGLMNDLAMEIHYSEPTSAILLAQEALKLSEENDFTLGKARSLFSMGMAFFKKAGYVEAFIAFQGALETHHQAHDRWGESNALNNIGLIYQRIGDFSRALEFFTDSLRVKEEAHDQYGKANVMISMAGIYRETGNLDEAKKIMEEVLRISREIEAETLMSKGLAEYGLVLMNKHSLPEASAIFGEALDWFEKQNNKTGIGQCLLRLGKIKLMTEDISEALFLFKKAQSIAEQIGDKNAEMAIRYEKATLYLKSGQREDARRNLILIKESAEELGEKPLLQKVDEALSGIYEEEGKFDLALFHFKKSRETAAEINVAEAASQLRNLEISRKVELLEKEKKLLEAEKQLALEEVRKRISSDLHDEIGAALSGFSIFSDVVKQEMMSGNLEQATRSIESIGDESRELLDRLSDIVWAINPRNDHFEKIIQRLRNYAVRMCSGKNIALNFEADESLDNITFPLEARNNFYLILKEAMNNAVKYSGCTQLNVSVSKSESKISASVQDNGNGFDPATISEGNGLLNMRHRAEEIHAVFDLRSSQGSGTAVFLNIPA